MNYAIQEITDALKSAREAKGLSQRALSARTGVPQSHISKIEGGGADIRLSSLIELARSLDLDLKLVPRKAIPVVDQVVRSAGPAVPATPALKELNRSLDAVKNLRTVYPDLAELTKLQDSLQTLKNLRNVGEELEALREIAKPVRELQKASEAYRNVVEETRLSTEKAKRLHEAVHLPAELKALQEAARIPAENLKAIQEAANAAQALRNQLVHRAPEAPSLPRPVYRLDEEEEDSDG